MGYKTTTNVNEAITDLAVMPMGNGYSIDAYKDMLDTYKESVIDPFVQSYMPAIDEYRENVEAGRPQAITAQAILNSYTDGFAIPDTKPEEWTNMTNDEYDEYKAGFAAISAKWNDTDKDLGDAFAYGELRSEVSEAEYEANPTDYKYTQWGCGDYGDLNGDVGKGWLALYTETNPEHDPIEAGTFVVKFNDEVPSGYDNAIHLFGSSAAVNLNSSRWDFNADTTYVYYKTDHIHTFTHGDVNNDGMIDIKDATEIQRYAAQFIELDSTALAAADVGGDGNVTIADATKIQRYIAKLINELVTVNT